MKKKVILIENEKYIFNKNVNPSIYLLCFPVLGQQHGEAGVQISGIWSAGWQQNKKTNEKDKKHIK